jgi:predicted metalloprotease with PDZ domain
MLDLSIRKEFKDLTLDDFMQNVWLAYGKTEIPYTISDLQQVLTKTTGDAAFSQRFFEESIYDGHLPDFQELLAPMGVSLSLVDDTEVYFGRTGIDKNGKLLTAVKRGTGWYEAGVEKGDTNITLDGRSITDQETFRQVKNTLEIGKSYEVTFNQLGVWRSGRFTATQDPSMKTQLIEKTKKKEIKNRSTWLWID